MISVWVLVVPFAGAEWVLLETGALDVPLVGKTTDDVVERDELLVVTGTLLVLLREADEDEEEMIEDEVVGTTMLDEELVVGWQPPLQEVYVRVDVVKVVTVTTLPPVAWLVVYVRGQTEVVVNTVISSVTVLGPAG